MSIYRNVLPSLLRIILGVPLVSLLLVGLLILFFSVTWRGHSVGLGIVLLMGVLYCSVGYWQRAWFKAARGRVVVLMVLPGLSCYLVPMSLAFVGAKHNQQVRSCFLRNEGHLNRFSPVQTVPELDQLNVAMSLLPLRDPHVDFAQARLMKSRIVPIYQALEQDSGFQQLGSALEFAYRDVLRMEFRSGHYFLFLPSVTDGEKVPCIVFLHGLGGNTKSRLWVLSRLSQQVKCAVIAPSFGVGNWDRSGGAELVIDVGREAIEKYPIDARRIFLMGYSNGAMGVTRAAIADPTLFKGLIYLSPVTEDQLFATDEFLQRRDDCQLLFLHGGQDSRIPRGMVESTVATLRRSGCNVQLKIYADEGHFLLMARPESVLADITAFLRAN